MLELNKNILDLPIFLLSRLRKEQFRDFFSFSNDEFIKNSGIEDAVLFISSIGKREFLSFPQKGNIILGEKVEAGIKNPSLFKELLSYSNIKEKNIIPLIIPLNRWRDSLLLLVTKKDISFTPKEKSLIEAYFKEKIRNIYTHGKILIKEGEGISLLLHLLQIKEKTFIEKTNIIFNISKDLIEKVNLPYVKSMDFLFTTIVYDLGKLSLKEEILSGIGKIRPEDKIAIIQHPYYTIGFINNISIININNIKKDIESHHENYNGSGYPNAMKKENIPEESRLLRILDTIGSLLIYKPYRKKLTLREATETIKEGAGSIYDPEMTKTIGEYLSNKIKTEINIKKYINKDARVILKKHMKSRLEGRVKEENGDILTLEISPYLVRWNEVQIPPLPGDSVILEFPSLGESKQGKVIDVSYTSALRIKINIIKNENITIRRSPRVPWVIPMNISDGEINCLALSTDISSKGAQIISLGAKSRVAFKKKVIDIEFALPPNVPNGISFRTKAEVIRYSKNFNPPFYKIIKFIDLTEESRILLEDFIRERQLDILFLE